MVKVKGNITKNFTFDEYGKSQTECVFSEDAYKHATRLQKFRDYLGKPMVISIWFRTKEYNTKVGGAVNSLHLSGQATDWLCGAITNELWNEYCNKWKEICETDKVIGEIGRYSWGIHLGSNTKAFKKFYTFDKR